MNIADIPLVEPSVQGRIAFARTLPEMDWPAKSISDIYSIKANGTDLRQLTYNAWVDQFWLSPDGTRIAYLCKIREGFPDAGGITFKERLEKQIPWDQEAFAKVTETILLCVMNADGAEQKCRQLAGDIRTGGWLLDGKRLFYSGYNPWPERAAYVIDPDAAEQRSLAPDDLPEVLSPLWTPSEYRYIEHRVLSPDRTKAALLAIDQHGQGNLDVSDVQTGNDLQVEYARNEYNAMIPAWSPNGEEIAFVAQVEDSIWVRQNVEALHIMNVRSGEIRKVVDVDFGDKSRHEVYPYAPVWSPDGSWIAFIGLYDLDGVSDDIYLINLDGSNLRRVTTDGLPKCNLVWQPGS